VTPHSPGIDEKELAEANALGKRIAEVTAMVKRGNSGKLLRDEGVGDWLRFAAK
jgi:hypothetical protein